MPPATGPPLDIFITVLFYFVMIIFCLFMRWVVFSVAGIVAQLGWPDLFLYLVGVPPPLLRRWFVEARLI